MVDDLIAPWVEWSCLSNMPVMYSISVLTRWAALWLKADTVWSTLGSEPILNAAAKCGPNCSLCIPTPAQPQHSDKTSGQYQSVLLQKSRERGAAWTARRVRIQVYSHRVTHFPDPSELVLKSSFWNTTSVRADLILPLQIKWMFPKSSPHTQKLDRLKTLCA